MLNYNEILKRKYIDFEGEPYEVLDAHVFRKQQRKPVNQTKLKNLITGKVTEHSFHQSEKINEAELDTRKIKYLYNSKGEYWFCEESDPKNRFKLDGNVVGKEIHFVPLNSVVSSLEYKGLVIGLKIPVKIDLVVTDAPPAVRGNTAQGGTKIITLETGATINAPLFINKGDVVRVNTETEEYTERVDKK